MDGDLAERVDGLTDADAVAALAFVLDVEDASAQLTNQLSDAQSHLTEAFATTPDLAEVTAPESDTTSGDLARAALMYLAEQEETADLVNRVLERPRREGQRDPVSLAVGGLVLLALRTEVQLKRTTAGKWSFSFAVRPVKDSALAGILGKLWGLFGGDH